MDEYITKEAAIQAFEWGDADVFDDYGDYGDFYNSGFSRDSIKSTINAIPTFDVAPVVHARWIDTDSEFAQCSLCKYPVYAAWNATNYCPNCGARMDGGSDNETS